MLRVIYIVAGLFLACYAVYVILSLLAGGSWVTLSLTAMPLIAALALGSMLVIRNVRKPTVEDEAEDAPLSESGNSESEEEP
jgi:hypothetical protein